MRGAVELRVSVVMHSAESWNALFQHLQLVYKMFICKEYLPRSTFWDVNL